MDGRFRYFFIRLTIIAFWVGIIGGILFISKLRFLWPQERVINVLTWGDLFDEATLAHFFQKTGIRVNLHVYSSNKELLSTALTGKCQNYDLIMASNFSVEELRKQNVLKKIAKDRITAWNTINPRLLGHYFDPDNDVSIPYNWEIFVLGYNRAYFPEGLPNISWDLIFKKPNGYKIVMLNDPVDVICLAACYIKRCWKKSLQLIIADYYVIKDLLINQRNWVEAYAEFRPDYFLLTESCPLALCSISPILRGMQESDLIDFEIPREGTFMTIENFVIPESCTHENLVYQFINYLFTPDVVMHHFQTLLSLPATLTNIDKLPLKPKVKHLFHLSEAELKKITFFRMMLPEKMLNDLWVSVKSH